MKQYVDLGECVKLGESFIPKDPLNKDWALCLKEIEEGEATLIIEKEPNDS